MWSTVRKLSTSRSSKATVTLNVSSSSISSCTNAIESRSPVSKRSMSPAGSSRFMDSKIFTICSWTLVVSDIVLESMLGSEQIVEDAVVVPAVDPVAFAQPADLAKIQAGRDGRRHVVGHHPGVHGVQAELLKTERQEPRDGARGVAVARERLVAEHRP